ncbi:hypothetical protein GBAR_LOCUS14883 [Geodia barretti]|uniref:Uncharacterized protein n=2 Tax=Geodia barretti TaxID=519541 RepID=A0AA35WT77_GEOBA|nr:hypothetical protein GBAR_LOCUS14883 [Geodia barretti]
MEVKSLFFFLHVGLLTLGQEILSSPKDSTVFLHEFAAFSCWAKGDEVTWKLNGLLLKDLPPELRKELIFNTSSYNSTLFEELVIPSKPERNGTTVQCLGVKIDGSSAESEIGTLIIQGLLMAVINLRAKGDVSSVTISWTAPFSLNVTGGDRDIWYSITIYNVTEKYYPTAIRCTDCTYISETHYTFTPDHLSPCDVYNFSVYPLQWSWPRREQWHYNLI